MKPNLKDFPSGQGVDCADFSIQVNKWKEAFEKQLQELRTISQVIKINVLLGVEEGEKTT